MHAIQRLRARGEGGRDLHALALAMLPISVDIVDVLLKTPCLFLQVQATASTISREGACYAGLAYLT